MKKIIQYHNVALSSEAKEQLDYLCQKTQKSRSQFLAEILEALFEIIVSLKPHRGSEKINMQIQSSILSQSVTVQFLGRNIILIGHFGEGIEVSDEEIDEKIKKQVEGEFNEKND